MQAIEIKAHAKINLSLDIIGRRADGYHDIDSVMQGIGLCDLVRVEVGRADCDFPHIECSCGSNFSDNSGRISARSLIHLFMNAKGLEPSEDNLAIKGAKAFLNAISSTGSKGSEPFSNPKGNAPSQNSKNSANSARPTDSGSEASREISIIIDKKLPISAGIAGGSGNSAVTMLALNAMCENPLSLRELMDIGASVGADVPFSIMMNARMNEDVLTGLAGLDEASVSARMQGIGEIVEPIEPIERYIIMANPGIAVSTKEVYEAIDSLPENKRIKLGLWGNMMEAYTLDSYDEADKLKAKMEACLNADKVLMSGSGPTMVAYYSDKDKWLADCEHKDWIEEGWRVWPSTTGIIREV